MTSWHANARVGFGPRPLTDDQIDAITAMLPGLPILQHRAESGELTLRFQVEAQDARAATQDALDAADKALISAGLQQLHLSAFQVRTDDDLAAELLPPDDVIGYSEIGEILGVSRQRA